MAAKKAKPKKAPAPATRPHRTLAWVAVKGLIAAALVAAAVRLPAVPDRGSLPLLATPVLPPTRHEGEVWDNPTVRRAAELAELYRPRRIEKTEKGWRLTQADGRAVVVSY